MPHSNFQSRKEVLRVLIVEDDRIVASDLRATVERLGHAVSGPANSAESALALVEKRRPDLALVDIRLAGSMDGIALAVALRKKFDTPVLFLTGYASEDVFDRSTEASPAGYLRKPFSDGELAAGIVSAMEREKTRREHVRRAEAMRHFISELEEGIILSDLEGRVTLMNEAAFRLTGWPVGDAAGHSLREVAPLAFGDETGNGNGHRIREERGFRTMRLRKRTGELVPVLERSIPIRGESGEALGVVSVFRSPEKKEKTRPGHFVDGADEPPARGPALAKAEALSQKPSFRELLGPRAGMTLPESDLAQAEEETHEQLPLFFEEIGNWAPEKSQGGGVEESAAIDELLSPLDEIGDPLLTLDPSGRISYANAEALGYFGGAHPLIGRDFWGSFAPDAKTRYHAHFQRAMLGGRRHHFEFHDTLRNLWLDVSLYRSSHAGEGGLLALFRDITERKRAEAESVRLQRLEGLGLLARGFAHDFNNLLTVLIGSLELAGEGDPRDPGNQEEMATAVRAAENARDLVQQLLTFAQGGQPIIEETRISDLLREVLSERRDRNPGVRYQFQSDEPGLAAQVDRRQIARLLENLVTNAEQAMPEDGGAIIARFRRISGAEASRLRNAPAPAEVDHAVIEVIDTGCGMNELELEHAFEPYYTTRAGVNATGIGLTVCESIAKSHGGFILLQSKEGRGTIASVCLPLKQTSDFSGELPSNVFMPRQLHGEGPPAAPGPMPALFSGGKSIRPAAEKSPFSEDFVPADSETAEASQKPPARILILEDDTRILRLIAVSLRREGYDVVETSDGHETIREYREAMESGRKFDLLLSDLTIENGLGGVETMRALRQLDPDVLAIVSSGYSDAPAMARPEDFGFSAVLPKPYPPKDLRNLVAEVLERHGRPGDEAVFPA